MKILACSSILLLLASAQAGDIMFFADDHYKSLARTTLQASAANPALQPGPAVLHISLANLGELKELMPINQSGPAPDIQSEMREEMKAANVQNINAALIGSGPILVTSGPVAVQDLPAGEKATLDYNVSIMDNASGWTNLVLNLSYQHQADVSVKSGEVYPLYEAERENLTVDVFVAGEGKPLRILGSSLEYRLGRGETLRAAIINSGGEKLQNCSARLLAGPPFTPDGSGEALGDLSPGSVVLAHLPLQVDAQARPQEYQMSCQVCCQEGCSSLPLTVTVPSSGFLGSWWPAALALLGLIVLAGVLARRKNLLPRDKRRRGPRRK